MSGSKLGLTQHKTEHQSEFKNNGRVRRLMTVAKESVLEPRNLIFRPVEMSIRMDLVQTFIGNLNRDGSPGTDRLSRVVTVRMINKEIVYK